MYKFTIIIPVYNTAFYLKNALTSIENQTFDKEQIQVLIIDDGSIDNTKSVIERYKKNSSLKIEYYYKENGNWGSVINFVKNNHLAKGDYITVLDSDDLLCPNALKLVSKIQKPYKVIIGNFKKVKSKSKIKVHTYSHFLKIPKNKIQAQTPFCIPLGKFLSKQIFYNLPELKENVPYQDALYTAHTINLAQPEQIYHINKILGIYNFKRVGNSMSIPWTNVRYNCEINICLQLLQLDAQEIVAIHVMRKSFRKLLDQSMFKFTINRKFKFKFFPKGTRWIMYLIYLTILKKYFLMKK